MSSKAILVLLVLQANGIQQYASNESPETMQRIANLQEQLMTDGVPIARSHPHHKKRTERNPKFLSKMRHLLSSGFAQMKSKGLASTYGYCS